MTVLPANVAPFIGWITYCVVVEILAILVMLRLICETFLCTNINLIFVEMNSSLPCLTRNPNIK